MSIEKGKYLTKEEIISIPIFTDINISDDGENVAFVKKTTDWEDNKYRFHTWIYENKNNKSFPITSEKVDSTSPLWSPDSKRLAYLSAVGEGDKKKNQIFIKDVNGYSGIQVTNEKEGVNRFKWSPDGEGFYFISKEPLDKKIKRRNEVYGDFEHVDKEYQYSTLFYIDISEGLQKNNTVHNIPKDFREEDENDKSVACELINGNDFEIRSFDISPNNEKIVFMATPTPNMEDFDEGDLYTFDVKTKKIAKMNKKEIIGGNIVFSPDGSKICFTKSINEKECYRNNIDDSMLEIYNLETGEAIHPLEEFDSSIRPVRWIEKGILVVWQEKTKYLFGILDESGDLEVLSEKEDVFCMNASITKDSNHIAYIKATSKETFEVYLDHEKITNESRVFENKIMSKKEVISWTSSDGLEVEGVLSTPYELDYSKKHPLLVVIHGGPTWASFPIPAVMNRAYPIEEFVEKGFIVLEPNYRGSSGYGDEFLKANYKKLGLGDYDDVISGVDKLIEDGLVDKERVGVMGWSQGGYISAFCTAYSDRFKAVSVGAGISNWLTYYVNTDIHQFTRMFLGDNPWNDPKIYAETSPMTYIKSACTPTLIQHGEKDTRVPTPNAYELYQGLRDMGVETELVIFKGMGHGANKPGLHRAIMKQNLMWFSHYILGESLEGFRE
ncbi:S9 family peptidase [Oceanirhabdus sp. W0125-5]|uniref:S9 family peptidase n=1 Tax=Oceanirhabdus sp. W0125-5 TaxID=2999116 RepID=UPI0022F2F8DB|nr:S9 family peptidase [Oceanirhabdus sp. W0125-5]WBW96431.1 S9 family peptidase [Oceanirhabdus sp. W0125-5]